MIKFRCPSCQTKLGVPDEYVGRRIRCSKCSQPAVVPHPVTEISSAPRPAEKTPIELQPHQTSELLLQPEDLPPVDHNAEVMRQLSRDRMNQTPVTSKSETGAGRTPSSGKGFRPFFGFGNFYLALLSALVSIVAVIFIWVLLSKLTGYSLEFLFIPTALAPGLGFCVFSRSRGAMIGILSVGLGCLSIFSARLAWVHCFILPEWKTLVASVDVTPEYEKFFTLMSQMGNFGGRNSAHSEIAEQDSEMIAVAICSLILEKQLDPVIGEEIYFKAHATTMADDDPNALITAFADTSYDQDWQKISRRLRQWDKDQRIDAARRYYARYLFFQFQCKQKAILDNYPMAIGMAFMTHSNCIFFALRVFYCVIGLIGAYKTCSDEYFE